MRRSHALTSILLSSVLSAGCAATLDRAPDTSTADLLDALMLAGVYDNRAQVEAAPADLKREPALGAPYDWLDRQHALIARVEAPKIGSHVYYLEWRGGGPDGDISRQRIWSFRELARAPGSEAGDSQVVMDFFTIDAPEALIGAADTPGAFADLSPDTLRGYGAACALPVAPLDGGGWTASIPETCVITSRSGQDMTLQATVRRTPLGLSYEEAGVRANGDIVFMVPGGMPYEFDPIR